MASAFDIAMRAIFTDPNMAVSASYTAGGFGLPQTVRILMRAPDAESRWNETAISTATTVIEVQVADIPSPANGDRFDINGTTYSVQGSPIRDSLQLAWVIELAPA